MPYFFIALYKVKRDNRLGRTICKGRHSRKNQRGGSCHGGASLQITIQF